MVKKTLEEQIEAARILLVKNGHHVQKSVAALGDEEKTIYTLGLTTRLARRLALEGIWNLSDLKNATESRIRGTDDMGKQSLVQLYSYMVENNFLFRDQENNSDMIHFIKYNQKEK